MRRLRELKTLGDEGALVLRFPEIKFDVEQLVRLYTTVSSAYPKTVPVADNPGYGGWTLLSDSGDYRDGWQQGKGYEAGDRRFEALVSENTQTVPTELFRYPEVQNMLHTFSSLGLKPIRTRIAEIEDGGKLNWHIDPPHPAFNIRWRAHLVVVTNDSAKFMWRRTPEAEVRTCSLPADGYLYLVRVDVRHSVESRVGMRVHIISDFEIIDGDIPLGVVLTL